MHNGTKFGLILIALSWLAASTAVSAHFVGKAQSEARERIPADVRYQGGLWLWTPAGASRLGGLAKRA